MKFQAARKSLARDRSGGTVIEYCLIAGMIGLAVLGATLSIGDVTNSSFTRTNDRVWGAQES